MVGEILIHIVKVGITSYAVASATKMLGQKEMGNMILGTGMVICGVDLIKLITPVTQGISKVCKGVGKVADFCEKITTVYIPSDSTFGEFIKRGIIESTTNR